MLLVVLAPQVLFDLLVGLLNSFAQHLLNLVKMTLLHRRNHLLRLEQWLFFLADGKGNN